MDSSASHFSTAALVSAILVVSAVTAFYFIKARAQKKVDSPLFPGLPFAPGAHWLLGHLIMLNGKDNFVDGYYKVYEQYADPKSGVCSFWFFSRPSISILLSHHVKSVLAASSSREPIQLLDVHNDNFLGPRALVSLMGKDWKRYRSAVHKSFTPIALKQAQASIHQVGNALVKSLLQAIQSTGSGSLPAQPLLPFMKMATMDVFGLAAMNIDFGCCQTLELTTVASAFEHLCQEYTRRLTTPWDPSSWLYWLPTRVNQKHRQQRGVIRHFIADQIAKTRSEMDGQQQHGKENNTLLANILRAAKAQQDDLSDEDLGDILMTLLFGGYDTTSITLTYAIYLLAKHPQLEAECLKEVQSVLKDGRILENVEEQLPYTQAVIMETLRLFPPAPVTARALEKPMELDGHVIPKGTTVMVPIWSVQRDARNFPRPTELLPERWVRRKQGVEGWEERSNGYLESDVVAPANRDAFCVFSAGARNCVGRKLALQEAVTLLAIMIQRLKFQVEENAKPVLCSVVQQPRGGLPVIITPR